MLNFRTDGIYIHKHDANIDGYITTGKDGKIKKRKYGLFDKLSEIYREGTTQSISYSYIDFYKPYAKEEIELHIGAFVNEFTDILLRFKNEPGFRKKKLDLKDYEVINPNQILVKNPEGGTSIISTNNNGVTLVYDYTGIYANNQVSLEFTFFSFI